MADGGSTRSAHAFATDVVVPNERRLGRVATGVLGDPIAAQDVVADAFLALWPRWRDGRIDDVDAYLYCCVVNRARWYLRRRALAVRTVPEQPYSGDDARLVDTQVCLDAIRTLPVNERAVVVLRYLEDRTEAEVARLLGIPLGTVKSRHARALRSLRGILKDGDE